MKLRTRRRLMMILALAGVMAWLFVNPESYETVFVRAGDDEADFAAGFINDGEDIRSDSLAQNDAKLAVEALGFLEVKGRAPKTGYSRDKFYDGWPMVDGCNLRQRILRRDFGETAIMDGCDVLAGEFEEPYTGKYMKFNTKTEISKGLQIDHVVALSDAWQKGAQYMSADDRYAIATDPLNLLTVDGPANMQKSDGDAATWLPSNKKFRCQYVARQVSVKYKYNLWVTEAEKKAILRVLENCPSEPTVGI